MLEAEDGVLYFAQNSLVSGHGTPTANRVPRRSLPCNLARRRARGHLYWGDADRRVFLTLLAEVCEQFNWWGHAYCLMTNHYHLLIETPDGNLSKGMRQLRHQVFLGSERFVENLRRKLPRDRDLSEVPRAQRRPLPKPLHHYSETYPDRDEAIAAAYASGGYTLKAIGEHFGLHYAQISRIVRRMKDAKDKT